MSDSISDYLVSKGFRIENDAFVKDYFGEPSVMIEVAELAMENLESFKAKAKRKGWKIETFVEEKSTLEDQLEGMGYFPGLIFGEIEKFKIAFPCEDVARFFGLKPKEVDSRYTVKYKKVKDIMENFTMGNIGRAAKFFRKEMWDLTIDDFEQWWVIVAVWNFLHEPH